MRSVLSLLGAIFLIILAIRFFPILIAAGLSIGVVVLVVLVFMGIAVILAPILILLLLVGSLAWMFRAFF